MGNFIATCSTMFRRVPLGKVPDWYEDFFPITDWPLHIWNAERGKIGYIPEVMGAYRYHIGGFYSTYSEIEKQNKVLEFLKKMNQCLEYKYDDLARTSISKYFFEWAEEYENRGSYPRARECFRVFLSGKPMNKYIPWRKALKLGLKVYLFGLLKNNKSRQPETV
jgi:hypothetical protein